MLSRSNSFICKLLNGLNYCYVTVVYLHTVKWSQVFIGYTNDSIEVIYSHTFKWFLESIICITTLVLRGPWSSDKKSTPHSLNLPDWCLIIRTFVSYPECLLVCVFVGGSYRLVCHHIWLELNLLHHLPWSSLRAQRSVRKRSKGCVSRDI